MLYSAPEQYTLTKCTLQRTGNKVRKCAKRCVFLVLDLRTRESIGKQRKIGHKTRFVYFGRAICVIHELILCVNCCSLGKK